MEELKLIDISIFIIGLLLGQGMATWWMNR